MKNWLSSEASNILVAGLLILFGRFAAKGEEPFTIAIIPDSQYLVARYQSIWLQECQWIVNHRVDRNIRAAIQVGDLVDDARQGYQWTNAIAGLNLLKQAGIPVIISPGNHDMDTNAIPQALSQMTRQLPQSWFTSSPNWTGGFLDSTNLAGSYLLVPGESATYLIVALSWVPDDRSVNWANSILNQFSNCPAIFATHCYTDDTDWGRRAGWSQYFTIESGYRFGEFSPWWTVNRLWNNWLSKTKSVFWVISGHLSNHLNSMYFSDLADDGHLVTQSLCDYQFWQPSASSANGIMQLLTVYPDDNRCHIETFDTHTGQVFTNWNEDYAFPIHGTSIEHPSRWQQAMAAATNGLVLWNGFDRTNQDGFVGLSPFQIPLGGAVSVAPDGVYVNCYPAFSNMVTATEIDALTGLGALTVSLWFKGTNDPPSGLGVLASKFVASTNGEWYLATLPSSRIRWTLVNTNSQRINLDVATPTPVTDGNWHYLAGTYDGSNAAVYFDGGLIGTMKFSGRLRGTPQAVGFGGSVGQTSPTTSSWTPLCFIDRVQVWNRALGQDEITSAYVHGLATVQASRTNAVESSATPDQITAAAGQPYYVRFAVAGNPSVGGQQRLLLSSRNTTVADVSMIETNGAAVTNWVYTSLVVPATESPDQLQFSRFVEEPGSGTNSGSGPLLADVTAMPFTAPSLSASFSPDGNYSLTASAYQGLAYQLQTSQDMVNWKAASAWIVASNANLTFPATAVSQVQQFFRMGVKW